MSINYDMSLTFVMLEHHRKINAKLTNLLSGVGMDDKQLQIEWQEFRDLLLKHITTEEQVIFSFTDFGSPDVQKTIREVLSQHGRIRESLDNINFQRSASKEALKDLQNYLYGHEAIENEVLYPKMDKNLDESGRNFLLKKIEQSS